MSARLRGASRALLVSGLAAVAVGGGLPMLGGTALAATGTALSLQAPSATTYGQPAALTGRLVRAGTSYGLSGRGVVLQSRPRGSLTWTRLGATTTAAGGTFRLSTRPVRATEYRAVFAGSTTTSRATSTIRAVGVRALVRAVLDTPTAEEGDELLVHVSIAPAQPGGRVGLQKLEAGAWVPAGTALLGATSSAVVSTAALEPGQVGLRVVRGATAQLLAGTSGTLVADVSALPAQDPTVPGDLDSGPPTPTTSPSDSDAGGLPPEGEPVPGQDGTESAGMAAATELAPAEDAGAALDGAGPADAAQAADGPAPGPLPGQGPAGVPVAPGAPGTR